MSALIARNKLELLLILFGRREKAPVEALNIDAIDRCYLARKIKTPYVLALRVEVQSKDKQVKLLIFSSGIKPEKSKHIVISSDKYMEKVVFTRDGKGFFIEDWGGGMGDSVKKPRGHNARIASESELSYWIGIVDDLAKEQKEIIQEEQLNAW